MKKIQPSFDTKRQTLGGIFPLDTPFTVIIDTSEVCQFKCKYCFRAEADKTKWGYAVKNNVMDWQVFCKAVEQIKEFPDEVKQISLSNHGEPLCNRRLPEMVRYIKQNGIKSRISIHTNAALLDEKYVRELAESNIDRIVVSLQGLTAESYQTVCGVKIDYERFYKNLEMFYKTKKNTQVCIKVADTALKEGEERKFYELYEPIADRVFVENIVPIWLGVETNGHLDGIKNKFGESFTYQECCPLIFHTIVITPNGDVYPCTQLLRKDTLGNINEATLIEMWAGEERKKLLLRQCDLNNPQICEKCHIRQNSIYTKEDMIDEYRLQIRERLLRSGKNGN